MKNGKITVMRKACYPDLMEKFENPIEHTCDVQEGQVWVHCLWDENTSRYLRYETTWFTTALLMERIKEHMKV